MALDWSNERYVRLYTRITPDMALWCWQARAIWPWLLAIAERSGDIAAKRAGARGLAKLIALPVEVVEAGLVGTEDGAGLLDDGCIVATASGYAIRNYVEAQTAVASVNKRAADHRARQRLGDSLGSRNYADSSVTRGHAESRDVTESNAASREVTPSGTDPSGTEPIRAGERERGPAAPAALFPPEQQAEDPTHAFASHAAAEISRVSGRRYGPSKAVIKLCRALVRAGHTADEVTLVAEHKAREWLGGKLDARVCPATLLAVSNFGNYLDEARAGPIRASPAAGPIATPRMNPLRLEDIR